METILGKKKNPLKCNVNFSLAYISYAYVHAEGRVSDGNQNVLYLLIRMYAAHLVAQHIHKFGVD